MEKQKQQKLQAQDLFDLMVDTNAKVTELAVERSKSTGEKKSVSKVATAVNIILIVIGTALIASIFLPQVWELLHITFVTEKVLKWMYFGYAVFSAVFATVTKVKVSVRLMTILLGIAPMAITLILSLI